MNAEAMEYFRKGNGQVWHIARAFSHLALPERNVGRALCGYRVALRTEATTERPEQDALCEKCARQEPKR